MVIQVAPLSVEYSIRTVGPGLNMLTQVMVCEVPACQTSPPFGVTTNWAACPMVKLASLTSRMALLP